MEGSPKLSRREITPAVLRKHSGVQKAILSILAKPDWPRKTGVAIELPVIELSKSPADASY